MLRIENFFDASIDDIAAVHKESYVRGLEKVSCWAVLLSLAKQVTRPVLGIGNGPDLNICFHVV